MGKRFQITRPSELPAVECPCGQSRRAFVDDADGVASLHITDISVDARTHYHKRLTEMYYILEGSGEMELDGERHAIGPGDAILIKPLCRHRAIGRMRIINIPVPVFDPTDEYFD
jgi:mannose-6-phosphate isomerase-like protein (cupin superfamily)